MHNFTQTSQCIIPLSGFADFSNCQKQSPERGGAFCIPWLLSLFLPPTIGSQNMLECKHLTNNNYLQTLSLLSRHQANTLSKWIPFQQCSSLAWYGIAEWHCHPKRHACRYTRNQSQYTLTRIAFCGIWVQLSVRYIVNVESLMAILSSILWKLTINQTWKEQ